MQIFSSELMRPGLTDVVLGVCYRNSPPPRCAIPDWPISIALTLNSHSMSTVRLCQGRSITQAPIKGMPIN